MPLLKPDLYLRRITSQPVVAADDNCMAVMARRSLSVGSTPHGVKIC
ncbi:MAG: hypothetical protein VB876_10945 [Pirellulales bacterium]